jgi:hypothetical protein
MLAYCSHYRPYAAISDPTVALFARGKPLELGGSADGRFLTPLESFANGSFVEAKLPAWLPERHHHEFLVKRFLANSNDISFDRVVLESA